MADDIRQRNFDDWLAHIREMAEGVGREVLREPDDDWQPMLFMDDGTDLTLMQIPMELFAPETKQMLLETLTDTLRLARVRRAALLVSTWFLDLGKGQSREYQGSLADAPGRKEGVIVSGADADDCQVWMAIIERRPDGPPMLGVWSHLNAAEGAITEMLCEGVRG